jgi:nitrogen fixation/metabolism regulation signal transduction histidine kinase
MCVFAFLAATLSSFLAVSDQAARALLPAGLTATLLVGTLVPAMAILVLVGRWMARRRAAASIGGKGRLHTQLVFLFSVIAAVPTLLVVILPRCCSSRAWNSGFPTVRAGCWKTPTSWPRAITNRPSAMFPTRPWR